MGQWFSRWVTAPISRAVFKQHPEGEPELEDANKELSDLGSSIVELSTEVGEFINNDNEMVIEFWDHIMVKGNFKNEIKEAEIPKFTKNLKIIIDIGKKFYVCSDPNSIRYDAIRGPGYYDTTSTTEKNRILYNNFPALREEICKKIRGEIKQRKASSEQVKKILDSARNGRTANQATLNSLSNKFCVGKVITHYENLIKFAITIMELEKGYLKIQNYIQNPAGGDGVLMCASRFKYDALWNKYERFYKSRGWTSYGFANDQFVSDVILTNYINGPLNVNLDCAKGWNNSCSQFFKSMESLIYRLEHFDYPILGNIPSAVSEDNYLIKNNDTIVISIRRNNQDERHVIRIGDFGFQNYDAFGSKLKDAIEKSLPGVFRFDIIYPPTPNSHAMQNAETSLQNNFIWKTINNLYQKLGGVGFSREYNDTIVFIISSEEPFTILGNDPEFRLQKWLGISQIDISSRVNNIDDIVNGARDSKIKYSAPIYDQETGMATGQTEDRFLEVKAPGPYFQTFGGFSKNEADLNKLKFEHKSDFSKMINGFLTERLIGIGYKASNDPNNNIDAAIDNGGQPAAALANA